jgi:hypothetical protein
MTVSWRAVPDLLPNHPDLPVEIVADHGVTSIFAERYQRTSPMPTAMSASRPIIRHS